MGEIKEIIIEEISMRNFKRFLDQTIVFGERMTDIFCQNYKGKSSIADAFAWVLFNKSATGNVEGKHFRPRRHDENGVNIDHVDVEVILKLKVDGEEVKIRKVQKQNWVRHHGDDFESYTGDSMEYEWNDVPVKATDYKKKVPEIIEEDVFMMLINPYLFPAMDAKKQRQFLLEKVANITDEDVIDSNPEFSALWESKGSKTLEELEAQNKKELQLYKAKMDELPIRIDQESKRITDTDFTVIEKKLQKLNEELALNESKIEDTGKAYEALNELRMEKAQLEAEIVKIESEINSENSKALRDIKAEYTSASNEYRKICDEISDIEKDIELRKTKNVRLEEQKKELQAKYLAKNAENLDENALICPTCGQDMPDDKKAEIQANFEDKKAKAINDINAEGQALKADIIKNEETIKTLSVKLDELNSMKDAALAKENEAKAKVEEYSEPKISYEDHSTWCETKKKIAALEDKISGIDTSDADQLKANLKAERETIQESIKEANSELAMKKVIENAKVAVEELSAEMKQVTQSLANCEKLEKTINKFNAAKMDMLSERVNGKFREVKWKLFNKLKNGKYEDVCVCMIHGAQYGENTTSATERMMAGMDIIRTLQEIYQVKAPIFIDDVDLYNEWNIPDIDSQIIKLHVSTDDELRIEVK